MKVSNKGSLSDCGHAALRGRRGAGVVGQASRKAADSLGVRRRPGDRHVTGSGKG